ncbi:MAG: hypothetical protein KJ732_04410 [Candidatus Margulisbacteria bacterium]|nr:hypothetical protein [Candidatus Margulisiibacteriota bacterium]
MTVLAFVVVFAGMVSAQADDRSAAEKLAAGRAYLKLLDQKIIRLRNEGKAGLVKQMQADKKATIARMQAWKAEAESEMAAPPPPPRPVAPTPPPRPAARPAAPSAGLFGMGINTGYSVGYLAGNSVIVGRGDLILSDPLGIGPMLGLADDAIAWKVGLGGALASKDINDNERKAIPLFVDGILNIPADVMGGVASYVGGGVNYVLYGSGRETGSYGGQVYYGIQGDIGLGGNSYAELAYSIIRSGATTTPYSMKGIGINIGTQIVL